MLNHPQNPFLKNRVHIPYNASRDSFSSYHKQPSTSQNPFTSMLSNKWSFHGDNLKGSTLMMEKMNQKMQLGFSRSLCVGLTARTFESKPYEKPTTHLSNPFHRKYLISSFDPQLETQLSLNAIISESPVKSQARYTYESGVYSPEKFLTESKQLYMKPVNTSFGRIDSDQRVKSDQNIDPSQHYSRKSFKPEESSVEQEQVPVVMKIKGKNFHFEKIHHNS